MLVSHGGRSYIRSDVPCRFKRNGSYIDVWFTRNGEKQWIGIQEDYLRSFLNAKIDEGTGTVTVDSVQNTAAALEEIGSIISFMQTEALQGYGT